MDHLSFKSRENSGTYQVLCYWRTLRLHAIHSFMSMTLTWPIIVDSLETKTFCLLQCELFKVSCQTIMLIHLSINMHMKCFVNMMHLITLLNYVSSLVMTRVVIIYLLQTRWVLYYPERILFKETIEILSFIFDLNITIINRIITTTFNFIGSVKVILHMHLYIMSFFFLMVNLAGIMIYEMPMVRNV